jgi:hypothetical protein
MRWGNSTARGWNCLRSLLSYWRSTTKMHSTKTEWNVGYMRLRYISAGVHDKEKTLKSVKGRICRRPSLSSRFLWDESCPVSSGQEKADASATLGSFIANDVRFDKQLYSAEIRAGSEEPMVSFHSSSVPWSSNSSASQSERSIPLKDPWNIQKKRNFSENSTSDFWAWSPYFWTCSLQFWELSFLFQMAPLNFWIAKLFCWLSAGDDDRERTLKSV